MTQINSFNELEELRQRIVSERNPDAPCITVCAGTGCLASGSRDVIAAFDREIEARGLEVELGFRSTGCHGFCEKGPIVIIDRGESEAAEVEVGQVASGALAPVSGTLDRLGNRVGVDEEW